MVSRGFFARIRNRQAEPFLEDDWHFQPRGSCSGAVSYLGYREIRKGPASSQAAGSGEHSSQPIALASISNASSEILLPPDAAEKSDDESETLPPLSRTAEEIPQALQRDEVRPKLQQASIRRQVPARAQARIRSVQVAAVMQETDAYKVLSSLKQKNFAAFISPPVNDGFYRVQLGPYQTREAARASLRALEQAGYKPFIRRASEWRSQDRCLTALEPPL